MKEMKKKNEKNEAKSSFLLYYEADVTKM